MATQGTPNGGLDDIASLAYAGVSMQLVAYTNTPNSLGSGTVAADLTQPAVANGYAPITLDGTWSSTNGVITYEHSEIDPVLGALPKWIATGTWSATVVGVAIIRGAAVRHFKDLTSAFTAAAAKKLVVDLATVVN